MITVKEAKDLIDKNCRFNKIETHDLLMANGRVLASAILAPIDTPPFDQSAMDGYAFSFANWDKMSNLTLVGEIQAGNYSNHAIRANEAVRIFTGAPIPPGTDTVVIQEKTINNKTEIEIIDNQIQLGDNVRPRGSQTKKGELALESKQVLSPVGISFLAGIGINEVEVFSNPSISIIVTGKELVSRNDKISEGKIFESNSIGLVALCNQIGIQPVSVAVIDDVESEIIEAISTQLTSDILILTGGVSVGDYDLVPASLMRCGVEKIFHKVKQKPGKPIYFGRKNETLIFALPGNPAAVMSCFYEYVLPAISSFTQKKYFTKQYLPLAEEFYKKRGLTFFMKGKIGENNVKVLTDQESYKLNSFAVSDCIVAFDEDREHFSKGELVPVQLIV